MFDDGQCMVRFLPIVVVSLSVLGPSGCDQTRTFVGAVACQGLARPATSNSREEWSFRGLDPRVRPRLRPGSYASATRGSRFIGPEDLGSHRYWLDGEEGNGIMYTCAGGHIDIAHVRKAADWTGYLAAATLGRLHDGRTSFQLRLSEPSRYTVELTYPPDWDSLSPAQKERVAREVSRQLGQFLAYTGLTWHEILTWFGFRPEAYKSEFPSAFSWEDSYSNLLGACLAGEALQDQERAFNDAMTVALRNRLESLGVQPATVARQTSEAVRGDWYSKRWLFTVINKRNFDIGLDDGQVTPCLLQDVSVCEDAQAQPLTVPTLDGLAQYGFSATVTIEPRVWEQGKIFRVLHGNAKPTARTLDPRVHFAPLIEQMKQDSQADLTHQASRQGGATLKPRS